MQKWVSKLPCGTLSKLPLAPFHASGPGKALYCASKLPSGALFASQNNMGARHTFRASGHGLANFTFRSCRLATSPAALEYLHPKNTPCRRPLPNPVFHGGFWPSDFLIDLDVCLELSRVHVPAVRDMLPKLALLLLFLFLSFSCFFSFSFSCSSSSKRD